MERKSLRETIETAWTALFSTWHQGNRGPLQQGFSRFNIAGRGSFSEAFGTLTPALIHMFQIHCKLADSIRDFQLNRQASDPSLSQTYELLMENLEKNIDMLVQQIAEQSGRKIKLHKTSDGESLWRIAKKYDSDMQEIFELNQLENVFTPESGKLLLVPVTDPQP